VVASRCVRVSGQHNGGRPKATNLPAWPSLTSAVGTTCARSRLLGAPKKKYKSGGIRSCVHDVTSTVLREQGEERSGLIIIKLTRTHSETTRAPDGVGRGHVAGHSASVVQERISWSTMSILDNLHHQALCKGHGESLDGEACARTVVRRPCSMRSGEW
jgi:hypothetical protein